MIAFHGPFCCTGRVLETYSLPDSSTLLVHSVTEVDGKTVPGLQVCPVLSSKFHALLVLISVIIFCTEYKCTEMRHNRNLLLSGV
jgi:hypothetical protein